MDMLSKQKGLRKDFILNANFQLCNSGQVTQLFNLLPKLWSEINNTPITCGEA